jgi:aminoglycoside phosphotransferase (APT) family kinase protein
VNPSFNPALAKDVEAGILETFRSIFGSKIHLASDVTRIMSATSAWVWFLEIAGENLPSHFQGHQVLRISEPNSRKLQNRQVALSEALFKHGFPAPIIYWHGELHGYPAQLQQRLPGHQAIVMLGTFKLRSVIRSLGSLQATLHNLPAPEFDLPVFTAEDFLKNDLEARLLRSNIADPSGTIEWLRDNLSKISTLSEDSFVLCHGDFHPLNALVSDEGQIGMVDWDDACIGDRHHDVGRTMATYWFGSLLAENSIQRLALRLSMNWIEKLHLRAYEEKAELRLEGHQIRWWQVAHLFRFWLQILELRNGKAIALESTTTSSIPSDLGEQILKRCLDLLSKD